jgi:drug/metabolite transporter (DMT)-like permease
VSRRPLLLLVLLAALWGASFMFIKVAVRELAPTTLVALRMTLGTLTVAPLALLRVGPRELWSGIRANARALVGVSLFNSVIPIVALSWAEKRIDSGLAGVIQASARLFAAVLTFRFARDDRVTGSRLVGLLVGFAGVALLVGAQPSGDLTAALAVVFTGFCYAVAAVAAGRTLGDVDPLVTTAGTLGFAALVMLPFGLAQLPGEVPGWKTWASMLALGIGGTGVAYVIYYEIIRLAGASYGILITYLVPAVALGYGAAVLDEPVHASALAGLALVLTGVGLGTGVIRRRRAAASVVA